MNTQADAQCLPTAIPLSAEGHYNQNASNSGVIPMATPLQHPATSLTLENTNVLDAPSRVTDAHFDTVGCPISSNNQTPPNHNSESSFLNSRLSEYSHQPGRLRKLVEHPTSKDDLEVLDLASSRVETQSIAFQEASLSRVPTINTEQKPSISNISKIRKVLVNNSIEEKRPGYQEHLNKKAASKLAIKRKSLIETQDLGQPLVKKQKNGEVSTTKPRKMPHPKEKAAAKNQKKPSGSAKSSTPHRATRGLNMSKEKKASPTSVEGNRTTKSKETVLQAPIGWDSAKEWLIGMANSSFWKNGVFPKAWSEGQLATSEIIEPEPLKAKLSVKKECSPSPADSQSGSSGSGKKWSTLYHRGVLFPPPYVPHGVPLIYAGRRIILPPDAEERATCYVKYIASPYNERKQFSRNFFKQFIALLNDLAKRGVKITFEDEKDGKYVVTGAGVKTLENAMETNIEVESGECQKEAVGVIGDESGKVTETKKETALDLTNAKPIRTPQRRPKGKRLSQPITNHALCDFTLISDHVAKQSEIRKARTAEEKAAERAAKAEQKRWYGVACVDGNLEPLGNYVVEPPGIFLGRGDHPQSGCWKDRISPSNITLNVARDAPVPVCPVSGEEWGKIVHNQEVTWTAHWTENIFNNNKYVLFSAASTIRKQSDRLKYEVARELKKHVEGIRERVNADLTSPDVAIRQRATAIWLIDRLALRVGNEKREDEADTVGCCSLRLEHMKLHSPRTIMFQFLGKDSMPYRNTISVPPIIYANLSDFIRDKTKVAQVFDKLTPSVLNRYLTSQMPGLTAKVFRTYNASITLQRELSHFKKHFGETVDQHKRADFELVFFYNQANREVARLCNHQRTIPKGHKEQVEKIDAKIAAEKETLAGKKAELEEKKMLIPPKPNVVEKLQRRCNTLENNIHRLEANKRDRGEGSEIQNSTSKINYMDPRITIAWCRQVNLNLKKIFSKTLLEKFQWAISEIDVTPRFSW